MKKLLLLEIVIGFVLPAVSVAQNDLNGTWKIDLNKSVPPTEPEILLLQNGIYHCRSCVPKIDIKADGQDQNVAGNPYYDAMSVKILNDRSIEETEKKNGTTVRTAKMTVSENGRSATVDFVDHTKSSGDPVTGKLLLSRPTKVKRPPAGSHAISGSWQISKMADFSDNALMFSLMIEGDTITATRGTGQSYTAKLDGTDAPYKGDPGVNSVSVVRLGERTFMETDKRGPKEVGSTRVMMLPGSSRTINLIVNDTVQGRGGIYYADKQ